MNFTREPIIETVVTPKEGYKLSLRSSSNNSDEEHLVDAVEVVSFGSALFFRSVERPKAFLLPVQDYEVVETKEARVVLKKASMEKSIKIGSKKTPKVSSDQESSESDDQQDRGKKRRSRRRRSTQSSEETSESNKDSQDNEEVEEKIASTEKVEPNSEAKETIEEGVATQSEDKILPPPRKMIPPPSSLISDHIVRIKDMTSGGAASSPVARDSLQLQNEDDNSSEMMFEEIEKKENEDILKSASADSDFFTAEEEDGDQQNLLDPSEMPLPMPESNEESSEESKGKDLEEHLPDSTGDLFSEENHKSRF